MLRAAGRSRRWIAVRPRPLQYPGAVVARWVRLVFAAVLAVSMSACAASPGPPPEVVIAASGEPDSVLLANLYGAALRYYGTPVRVQEFDDPLAALDSGEALIAPGLTGELLDRLSPDTAGRSDEAVYKALLGVLPEGVTAGDYATAAEDKPAVAVTEDTVDAWGGHTLTQLVSKCEQLRFGRVAGAQTPSAVGACRASKPREFPDSAAMFAALRSNQINAAWSSSADPAVPVGVVLLDDRKPALIRGENALPLYRRNELDPQQMVALNEVAGVLDTAALKGMRAQLADGADPRALADAWLAENPIGN
ncbi:hypothetical protein H7I02_04815 [Mycolicibacterium brumae]|uniref:ABC-type glycine betaine transport system substrate-binding domain-containing protein n=2 Tax=Mycolicibacterium brumae TaxID=85968 RepID=A0A2G5PAN2_9MYCO|nr:hypothetical protein [Mycolicibacterium brumae]PIB75418.1 hypothetical protein CQY22_009810 [Mycolicibacterium brumae]